MKLGEIARALPATVIGDPALEIRRAVHPLDAANGHDLAVALSKEARGAGGGDKAGAILVPANGATPDDGRSVLVYSGHERVALAVLTALFDPGPAHAPGVHATAVVAPDATLGGAVAVGPHAVVGPRTSIGDRTVILANATIGADVRLGADCVIHPGVVLNDRVVIGDRVIIHPSAVIGADGFSFLPVRNPDGSPGAGMRTGMPVRVHSLGAVVIADDVEIGAGTTIDRGTLRDTRIGRGTKIDNQVQIGHNTVIGEACLICGQVGVAGSVVLGDRVLLGAGAGLSDHVRFGNDSATMAMSGVSSFVPDGTAVGGTPAVPVPVWRERYMQLGRLKMLYRQVETLKQRLEALEKEPAAR